MASMVGLSSNITKAIISRSIDGTSPINTDYPELAQAKPEIIAPNQLDEKIKSDNHNKNMEFQATVIDDLKKNTEIRQKLANRIFWVMNVFLVCIMGIMVITMFQLKDNRLDNSVLITLLTSSLATLVGLFTIVTKYFFTPNLPPKITN